LVMCPDYPHQHFSWFRPLAPPPIILAMMSGLITFRLYR
jgi:hypothetical protein